MTTQLKEELQGPTTIFASAARTATHNSDDIHNLIYHGLLVFIDCTVDPAAASVVFTIQGKDHTGGYYTLLESAAVASESKQHLRVYPGASAVANVSATDLVPVEWRVLATHADGDSITYSVAYEYIP